MPAEGTDWEQYCFGGLASLVRSVVLFISLSAYNQVSAQPEWSRTELCFHLLTKYKHLEEGGQDGPMGKSACAGLMTCAQSPEPRTTASTVF